MPAPAYVHGYSEKEEVRLRDQANTLAELLHHDTRFPAGSRVLEVGCGVGAQTISLVGNSPGAEVVSMDISFGSVVQAKAFLAGEGHSDVRFLQGNLFRHPFGEEGFDHIFVCFVLEHLADPVAALACLRGLLKPGGSITAIEGDHGSAYFHPQNAAANHTIECLVQLQARGGGDGLIGRRLYPLLADAGFEGVEVSPRMVYADESRPGMADGFTRKTFTAMVAAVREEALAAGLINAATWDEGIAALYRSAEAGGVFCYTFFKGTATK